MYVLNVLTRATVKRYNPRIIGVTGSVGKTSTKSAIYTVLSKGTDKKVRMAQGGLNNELSLPLAVLGNYKKSGGIFFWLGVIVRAVLRLTFVWSSKSYPDILVLEYGAEKPGDIEKLVKIIKPDIAVITAIGSVPAHVEFYESPQGVINEKAKLVADLGAGSIAILNVDEPAVLNIREIALAEVMTYGFDSSADVRITEFRNISKGGKPFGLFLKLGADNHHVSVTIDGIFGKSQAYAAAAATTVGLVEGMNLAKIAEVLPLYEGERGRARLLPGIKGSYIIDDTYNASPVSGEAALGILDGLEAGRKIAVLGDMLGLGKHTIEAHLELGSRVAKVADRLVTVGARAEFIKEGAIKAGFPESNIESFETSDDVRLAVQKLIKEGDLILIKGSENMRMEKIVLEIMAEPQRAKELLVRQYGKWLKK